MSDPTTLDPQLEETLRRIRAADAETLGRAITEAVQDTPRGRRIHAALKPAAGQAWRIGVTGAGGAGKSTLLAALAREALARGERVGIVASDPASPFTGGAFLGDRVRLAGFRLADEPRIFFRSLACRSAGAIGPEAGRAADLLDAAGMPLVFLETVGAGQGDAEIRRYAGTIIVVLPPGSGDEIQLMKAGIIEIAHILVVSRGSEPGAEKFKHLLEERVEGKQTAPDGWTPPVLLAEALRGEGIPEVLHAIDRHREWKRSHPHD